MTTSVVKSNLDSSLTNSSEGGGGGGDGNGSNTGSGGGGTGMAIYSNRHIPNVLAMPEITRAEAVTVGVLQLVTKQQGPTVTVEAFFRYDLQLAVTNAAGSDTDEDGDLGQTDSCASSSAPPLTFGPIQHLDNKNNRDDSDGDDDKNNKISSSSNNNNSVATRELSIHHPILIVDAPESLGMMIPQFNVRQDQGRHRPAPHKRRRKSHNNKDEDDNDNDNISSNNDNNSNSNNHNTAAVTVREIADLVGHSMPVHVIDVEHQEELAGWTLGDLVDYFEDEERIAMFHTMQQKQQQYPIHSNSSQAPNKDDLLLYSRTGRVRRKASQRFLHQTRHRVLNQISLEFSRTPLADVVRSPLAVRHLDWIDHAWSTRLRKRGDYPVVQYYCLTSGAGCYTDFHLDFGGTAVWYHVLSGCKDFCLIPPTVHNLKMYEEWLCRRNQSEIYLPDMLRSTTKTSTSTTKTNEYDMENGSAPTGTEATAMNSDDDIPAWAAPFKVRLESHETLFIPSGWIHAVYTPTDSVVMGGNYLHGLDMTTQLAVHNIEVRTRVVERFRFPYFVPMQFYAAGMYYGKIQRILQASLSPSSAAMPGPAGLDTNERKDRDVPLSDSDSSPQTARAGWCRQCGCFVSDPQQGDESSRLSWRELQDLPVVLHALEEWWKVFAKDAPTTMTTQQEQSALFDGMAATARGSKKGNEKPSVSGAGLEVAAQHGFDSFEEFLRCLKQKHGLIWIQARAALLGPHNVFYATCAHCRQQQQEAISAASKLVSTVPRLRLKLPSQTNLTGERSLGCGNQSLSVAPASLSNNDHNSNESSDKTSSAIATDRENPFRITLSSASRKLADPLPGTPPREDMASYVTKSKSEDDDWVPTQTTNSRGRRQSSSKPSSFRVPSAPSRRSRKDATAAGTSISSTTSPPATSSSDTKTENISSTPSKQQKQPASTRLTSKSAAAVGRSARERLLKKASKW